MIFELQGGGLEALSYFHYIPLARQKAVFLGGAAHFPKRQNGHKILQV